MEIEVKDNPAKNRFEATVEGHTAVIEYKLKPGIMTVLHTKVPEALEGRGIAGTMTRFALAHIAANKLELVALCPYMRAFLKKHPEFQHLLHKESARNE